MAKRSVLGYTGAYVDSASGAYPLGNGYRFYLPYLMRFAAPDSLSPFGRGGIHPYVYCACDPISRSDPSGHVSGSLVQRAARGAEIAAEDESIAAARASYATHAQAALALPKQQRLSPINSVESEWGHAQPRPLYKRTLGMAVHADTPAIKKYAATLRDDFHDKLLGLENEVRGIERRRAALVDRIVGTDDDSIQSDAFASLKDLRASGWTAQQRLLSLDNEQRTSLLQEIKVAPAHRERLDKLRKMLHGVDAEIQQILDPPPLSDEEGDSSGSDWEEDS